MGLVEDILKGDEKSAARLISQVEEGNRDAYAALSRLLPYTGKAHILGVTGPPGAGKSTIIGRLAVTFSDYGRKVGVIATDPTSIKDGGALLGDRLRMKNAEREHVFIRSLANQGYPGGVARATAGIIYILEGLGKDIVILESVGVGQSEKGLFHLCDTIITVFTPDYGDEIQLMKAGLREIGDIIVVNKADKPGAADAKRDLEIFPSNRTMSTDWHVPVLLTRANCGEGIEILVKTIGEHKHFLAESGEREQRKKAKSELFLMALLKEELWQRLEEKLGESSLFKELLADVYSGKIDPYSAMVSILDGFDIIEQGRKYEKNCDSGG